MRPSIDPVTLGGVLALAGVLLLGSPGVRVRAEEPASVSSAQVEEPAPVCQATAALNASFDASHLIESYRQQALGQQALAAASSSDQPILLNGRGYNYGPPPSVDAARLAFEAGRQRGRQR